MNQTDIEKIALEVGDELPDMDGGSSSCVEFATRFLERIDAERGKDAAAYLHTGDNGIYCINKYKIPTIGFTTQSLFLSPTIPKGMCLVPIEPTTKMVKAIDDIMWPGASEKAYRVMIAAAQGERK